MAAFLFGDGRGGGGAEKSAIKQFDSSYVCLDSIEHDQPRGLQLIKYTSINGGGGHVSRTFTFHITNKKGEGVQATYDLAYVTN